MEVAVLACLLNTEPTVDVSEQTSSDTGFGAILDKALGTRQNGKTAQKKTGQQEKTEDDNQLEDAVSELAVLLVPGMAGVTTETASINAGAAGQAKTQPLTTEDLPLPTVSAKEITLQPTAVGTEQFMATVTSQLDQAGQEIQAELTALMADDSPTTQQQTVTDSLAADTVSAEAVPVQETVQEMPASPAIPLAEQQEPQQKDSGVKKSAAGSAAHAALEDSYATQSLQSAETDTGDASTNSDTTGMEKSMRMEKGKLRSSEKSESTQTVSPYADLIASKTNRETELTQLREAVSRAMDQFETDFQSIKADGSTVRIALEPKELGSISITLSTGLNGVTAKIQTDNKDAASLISNQVQRMIQAMETKGVRVDSVEIACNQFSQQNFSGGADQYQGQTPTFVPMRIAAQQESSPATGGYDNSTAEQYTPADGVGQRVEYRI